jgi:hypothetical protein
MSFAVLQIDGELVDSARSGAVVLEGLQMGKIEGIAPGLLMAAVTGIVEHMRNAELSKDAENVHKLGTVFAELLTEVITWPSKFSDDADRANAANAQSALSHAIVTILEVVRDYPHPRIGYVVVRSDDDPPPKP